MGVSGKDKELWVKEGELNKHSFSICRWKVTD